MEHSLGRTNDGKYSETSTILNTTKTETENSKSIIQKKVEKDIKGVEVENKIGGTVSLGSTGVGIEIGQKQKINFCDGCSSDVIQYTKTEKGFRGFALETTNEFSRGTPLPAKTEIIYYKAAFKFIVGFEIKISAKPE